MTLRVLVLAEFDPCDVCISHRDALRLYAPGKVDYRVALHWAYTPKQRTADWVGGAVTGALIDGRSITDLTTTSGCTRDQLWDLVSFARSADVIQVCPGIGQPWASSADQHPGHRADAPLAEYLGFDWREIIADAPARVAYFHGSRNLQARLDEYIDLYRREHRCVLATSTLDYAVRMPAAYLPPPVPDVGERAALRTEDDPFTVAHTPTDVTNCHTAEFLQVARRLGVLVKSQIRDSKIQRWVPHEESLRLKRESHAVFDHLRGSFSVNTLEACALGCVPLVGLQPECSERLKGEGFNSFPGPAITSSVEDLTDALVMLEAYPDRCAQLQQDAYEWVQHEFSLRRTGARLVKFYSDVLAGG